MTTKNDITGDEIKTKVQTSSEYQDNFNNIFVGKVVPIEEDIVPIGEDTRPKDRIKQGISPHCVIVDINSEDLK
jgi:hypothetical protein